MKSANSVSGKGILDIDFDSGKFTLTEINKNGEFTYDFGTEVLERFNGKMVRFSFSEENDVEPTEES